MSFCCFWVTKSKNKGTKMNYGNIKYSDIANGEGVRTSLFVSGCTHHCKNCFNKETWDFNYGKPFTAEVEDQILKSLEPDYINGLSLLGGEPMEPANQQALLPFLKRVKAKFPNKKIWCYSGYLFDKELLCEDLPYADNKTHQTGEPHLVETIVNGKKQLVSRAHTAITKELLSYIDILVDGEFIEALKDITLRFKGSSNQRIIDVQASLKQNQIVLSPLNEKRNKDFYAEITM